MHPKKTLKHLDQEFIFFSAFFLSLVLIPVIFINQT